MFLSFGIITVYSRLNSAEIRFLRMSESLLARRVAQDLLISKWLAQSSTLNSCYESLWWMYTSKPEGIEAIITYNPFKKNIDAIAIPTNGLYLGKRWLMQVMSDNRATGESSLWQRIGNICNIC